MSENTSTVLRSAWFFISRLFILAGMILFFFSLFSFAGIYLCQWIYGYDFAGSPSLLSTFNEDPYVLRALKFLQVFITIGAMIIPAWSFPKALGEDPASFTKLRRSFNPVYILLAVALILISIPVVSWLIEVNKNMKLPASLAELDEKLRASQQATEALTEAFIKSTTTGDLLVNLFVMALVPAIAEEMLFRGALQQFVRYCTGNIHVAVICAAAVFSLFHGEVYAFLPRFALGILLGYLFAYSGSIWPAVIAHFANNALTLLASHFNWKESTFAFLRDDYSFPFYIIAVSLLLTIALIYLMHRRHHKETLYNGE